jgi:ubiquinone/menaquinone biosynthesis C-methylase UbiE
MATSRTHDERIQSQFSQQASTFAGVLSHTAEESLAALIELAAPEASDRALDVACGPGIVTCAVAQRVRSMRGQDVVPAMLEKARSRQAELGLTNIEWDLGDARALPYPDGTFDLVVTRFSFHHLREPLATLLEMRRVCRPGGRLVVADVAPAPTTSRAYDHVETLRDPSHTHALTEPEFDALFHGAALPVTRRARHGLPMRFETQLAASFPEPGAALELRRLFKADLGVNQLGVDVREEQGELHFTYPVLVLASTKPVP